MNQESTDDSAPKWCPIGSTERRVFGVLVEKAKTTPDAYPLTINSLTNGCNQKSNRSPLMSLDPVDVENALDELRKVGAITEVHGGGRMPKFRHQVYDWMGVDKVEAAVMAELLLRGEQTIGELRGRAARMEPIADVAALRPILASLQQKGLVQALTPEGRGQIVTHQLYLPQQQEKLKQKYSGEFEIPPAPAGGSVASHDAVPSPSQINIDSRSSSGGSVSSANSVDAAGGNSAEVNELKNELDQLKEVVDRLEQRLEQLEQLIQ